MRPAAAALVCVTALSGPTVAIEAQQRPLGQSTGVITGTVLDGSGRPVVGARVQAVGRAKKWAGPYYEIPTGRPDQSDDRGQFRLHSLPPGQYIVAVSVEPERAPGPAQREVWEHVRTFNPGATSLAEAEPIDVQGGEEQSVSVRLVPVPLMPVSGLVTTSDGLPAANFSVWLSGGPATIGYAGDRGGYRTTMVSSTLTGKDGSFSMQRVPPGSYTLTASNGYSRQQQPLSQVFEIGETPLEVSRTPVTGIKLATARGATVSGRLEWAGAGPVPWPRPNSAASLGRIRATNVSGATFDFASIDSEVRADGTFRFTNLYGLRQIQAMSLPFNWVVQSVDAPKELLIKRNLAITPGVDVSDVKVVVTNRTATLTVTLVDENDDPLATGWLLLMPTDPADLDPLGWGFRAAQRVGTAFFQMDRVLPGSYLAAAIDVEPGHLTGDSDLMERARAAAVRVDIPEGRMQLRVRVVRLRPFVRVRLN